MQKLSEFDITKAAKEAKERESWSDEKLEAYKAAELEKIFSSMNPEQRRKMEQFQWGMDGRIKKYHNAGGHLGACQGLVDEIRILNKKLKGELAKLTGLTPG